MPTRRRAACCACRSTPASISRSRSSSVSPRRSAITGSTRMTPSAGSSSSCPAGRPGPPCKTSAVAASCACFAPTARAGPPIAGWPGPSASRRCRRSSPRSPTRCATRWPRCTPPPRPCAPRCRGLTARWSSRSSSARSAASPRWPTRPSRWPGRRRCSGCGARSSSSSPTTAARSHGRRSPSPWRCARPRARPRSSSWWCT